MSLDDPEVVRAQYATEDGFETGDDAREVAFRVIAAGQPRKCWRSGPVRAS